MPSERPIPTSEENEELLECCRYGELSEVEAFVEKYGWEAVVNARDERGNTVLHMACGNGHLDVLSYLLPHLPPTLLQQTNEARSPPLHWAILNNHTAIVQKLVEIPEEQGGGLPLLKVSLSSCERGGGADEQQTNRAGRDAFSESLFAGEGKEEVAGWIEGYLWRAEGGDDEREGEVPVEVTETVVAQDTNAAALVQPPAVANESMESEVDGIAEKTEKVELR